MSHSLQLRTCTLFGRPSKTIGRRFVKCDLWRVHSSLANESSNKRDFHIVECRTGVEVVVPYGLLVDCWSSHERWVTNLTRPLVQYL